MEPFIRGELPRALKNRIVVVGFGGSGSNIIDNMMKTQNTNIEFINIDAEGELNISDSFKIIQEIIGILPANNENDINIDIADLHAIMPNREIAFVGICESQGEEAACEAITNAIEFTKNDNMSIQDASGVLVHCTIHPEFHFIKIAEAMEIVNYSANDSADIIFGTTTDATLPIDFIRVTLLITGFEKISMVAANNVQ